LRHSRSRLVHRHAVLSRQRGQTGVPAGRDVAYLPAVTPTVNLDQDRCPFAGQAVGGRVLGINIAADGHRQSGDGGQRIGHTVVQRDRHHQGDDLGRDRGQGELHAAGPGQPDGSFGGLRLFEEHHVGVAAHLPVAGNLEDQQIHRAGDRTGHSQFQHG